MGFFTLKTRYQRLITVTARYTTTYLIGWGHPNSASATA